mgnify:CR=1 FL=1|tara:strand:+ start:310 stop:540 length:231 start_codon:yes stop_codon:yes gene_type:complete
MMNLNHSDYLPILLNTGVFKLIFEELSLIKPDDFIPISKENFNSGKYDYWTVKTYILKKDTSMITTKQATDFEYKL